MVHPTNPFNGIFDFIKVGCPVELVAEQACYAALQEVGSCKQCYADEQPPHNQQRLFVPLLFALDMAPQPVEASLHTDKDQQHGQAPAGVSQLRP